MSARMVDRAHYLARTLVARLANLAANEAEDGRGEPDRARRIATIEKVLAVELGLTDGATMSVVESAAPSGGKRRVTSDEIEAFAEFLRRNLGTRLEEG